MPELPEVETVMRGMVPVMTGAKIVRAEARRATLRREIPADFSARLTDNVCQRLTRRSKYILAHFSDGLVMILHLGMSGKITLYEKTSAPLPPPGKHDHLIWETADCLIVFNDPRRFGLVAFAGKDGLDDHPLLRRIGPEPFSNQFNDASLQTALKDKKSPIKTLLLDQRTVAGIGNIYACEILWRSGLNPLTQAGSLEPAMVSTLVRNSRQVLQEAIDAGGSTLKDYARVDGELGYFQHSFKVYGREGEACLRSGCNGQVERITQSGRSTFYCSSCQL